MEKTSNKHRINLLLQQIDSESEDTLKIRKKLMVKKLVESSVRYIEIVAK